jgi:hypothetical protein
MVGVYVAVGDVSLVVVMERGVVLLYCWDKMQV